MEPDNITIYQMELPFNTVISREMKEQGITSPVAGWETKRRWVSEAMDSLFQAGYHISSGNELVRSLDTDHFVYRDHLFRGSDILATGVSSFGHFQGVHYQNFDQIEQYMSGVASGELPIHRALVPTPHQKLIREMVLQLKEGRISVRPFRPNLASISARNSPNRCETSRRPAISPSRGTKSASPAAACSRSTRCCPSISRRNIGQSATPEVPAPCLFAHR